MNTNTTKKWVVSALFAALTCICTMIIKIPTPTGGYIHPGDGMVLLCGIILGPGMGALAAGIGSMLSDLFSGYMVWVPATFIIKALTAMAAGVLSVPQEQQSARRQQDRFYRARHSRRCDR